MEAAVIEKGTAKIVAELERDWPDLADLNNSARGPRHDLVRAPLGRHRQGAERQYLR